MKALKIAFITIIVLVVFCFVGLFIFLKTFDINKYKPQILAQIKNAIGREVNVGGMSLDVSIAQGISLKVNDLKIADDPHFSNADFISIQNINLGVDIMAFINKREIVVSSVEVKSPKVVLIRNKNSELNAQSLAPQKEGATVNPSKATEKSNGATSAALSPSQALPMILVKSLTFKDGTVIFNDKSFTPEMSVEISGINLSVNNISLKNPIDFMLEASIFSTKKNVRITGAAQIDAENQSISLNQVKVASDLSDLNMEMLKRSLPMLSSLPLEGGVEGNLDATIEKMVAGAKGLTALSLDGKLSNGKAKIKDLPVPVSQMMVPFEVSQNDVKLNKSSLNLGSGVVTFTGKVEDYLKEQKFAFEAETQGVDLAEVVPSKDQPVNLQGKVFAQFMADGKGFNPETLLNSIVGKGTLEIKEGKLAGMNILKLVLSKISMIPNLVESIEAKLPDKYKESLNEKDTPLKKVAFTTRIINGSLAIDTADIQADTFLLAGKGTMTFQQDLDLQSTITIPQDLSKAMVASAEGLQYLLDDNGEVVIPLSVSGKVPNLAFKPDLEYLGKKIIRNKGEEMLEKVLDKALGVKKEQPQAPAGTEQGNPASTSTPQNAPSSDNQNTSPEKELIKGVLDKIFH